MKLCPHPHGVAAVVIVTQVRYVSQISSRRGKASLSAQRRRTVELFMGATSGAQPPPGRQAPFTSPQLMPRSSKFKAMTSSKGYSSDDDDENNNKFGKRNT